MTSRASTSLLALATALLCTTAWSHEHQGGIHADMTKGSQAAFDIVHTKISTDGNVWHSHWVVDIPEGTKPKLPKTWPGLPLLIDSPGWAPSVKKNTVEVRVPFDDIGVVQTGSFDGVTAALRVNASVHNPLLCVTNVFKVASGNLSLPGKVNQ